MAQDNTKVKIRVARYNGKLYLFAQTKGTSERRKRLIPGIEEEPNWKFWNDKAQEFEKDYINALQLNSTIKTFRHGFDMVNENFLPETCDDLMKLYNQALFVKNETTVTVTIKKETLGDFLQGMIDEQKKCIGHFIQSPSSTYQQYINLLHKLQDEGHIINTPIDEIDNSHCIRFSDYALHELKGTNYRNLMKWFISVHNKAVTQGKNSHVFNFSIKDNAPKKDAMRIRSLTKDQLSKFEAYDLSLLLQAATPKKTVQIYELYRDFALFMYEMKLRPIDTVKLTYGNICEDEHGNFVIEYVPEKKKNYQDDFTQCPLTEKARQIIRKYKGQSTKGYIFPFALNERDWDYTTPASYKLHYAKWNRLLEQINTFLHKLEKPLKFKGLTLYMFRHTAFTVACKEMKESYFEIAAHGGTSLKMLEDHYVATGYQIKGKANINEV